MIIKRYKSGLTQPEDKGILLKDIIEQDEVDRDKSYTIDANYWKGGNLKSYFSKGRRQLVFRVGTASDISGHDYNKRIYSTEGKSPTLNAGSGGNLEPKISIKTIAHGYIKEKEEEKDKYPSLCAQDPSSKHLIRNKSNTIRVGGKGSPPDSKQCWDNVYMSKDEYRKLTPVECERLQTVQDGWTSMVSNTQRYKMLGNGWNIDTIVHIFNCSPLGTVSCDG